MPVLDGKPFHNYVYQKGEKVGGFWLSETGIGPGGHGAEPWDPFADAHQVNQKNWYFLRGSAVETLVKETLASQVIGLRLFLTALDGITGNHGGVSGADALCTSDTTKPSGSSTWKAFIVRPSVRVACTTANCSGGTSEHTDWVLSSRHFYVSTHHSTGSDN